MEIHPVLVGTSVRPLPTTTEGWLIQISADVAAMGISLSATNDKIDLLINGAIGLDGRLDVLEKWRVRVTDDVERLPTMLDWQQAMDTRFDTWRLSAIVVSAVISVLGGIIGATVAVLTHLPTALGHP